MKILKKILNVILIIFGAALIAVCAELIYNKMYQTDFYDMDETDRGAIEELCLMNKLFDERYGSDEIWNESYNLRKYPFVFTREGDFIHGRTYVVNMDMGRNLFAQSIKMPADYADMKVFRLSRLTPQLFDLSKDVEDNGFIDIFGNRAYRAVYDEQTVRYKGTGSLEEECVKQTFEDAVESVDVPVQKRQFDINSENLGLLGLQYRLIDDMLSAENEDDLKEYITEYVVVREAQTLLDEDFAETVKQIETKYGSEQYVFYKISKKINHNITYFNKEEEDSITFYSAYYYLCTGKYNSNINDYLDYAGYEYTGAALCRIIDDNDLAYDWEHRIDENTSPYDIIKKYCNKYCADIKKKSLDDIKEIYSYDEINELANTLVENS